MLLRQRRHERALAALDALLHLVEQVVDLAARRPHLDHRVEQARRADHLLDDLRADRQLVRARRRRDEDDLVQVVLELLEVQRPVVQRRRQPEAEVDQRLLARRVAVVHAAHLRDRDVRLVDEHQEVVREVVEQRPRRAARRAARQVPAVVLDAGAVARLAQRLEVVVRALLEPRRLQDLALRAQLAAARSRSSISMSLHRRLELVVRRDEVLRRVDVDRVALGEQLAGQRVDLDDALDLVAEEVDAHRQLLVRRLDRDAVAAHAELAAHEVHVVALVLHVDEAPHDARAVEASRPSRTFTTKLWYSSGSPRP